jgi:hypothetical protein
VVSGHGGDFVLGSYGFNPYLANNV